MPNDPARNMTPEEQAAHWGERLKNAEKRPTLGATKAADLLNDRVIRPSLGGSISPEWFAGEIDTALGLPELIEAFQEFVDRYPNNVGAKRCKAALARLKGE